MKPYTITVIIDDGGTPLIVASGDVTRREHETLTGRIASYMTECKHRRQKEAADERAAEQQAHIVCMHCNDSGEVRKRVFDTKRKRWKFVPGTMPCPTCVEKQMMMGDAVEDGTGTGGAA